MVGENRIDAVFKGRIDKEVKGEGTDSCGDSFAVASDNVAALVDAVASLYENMDASLRFTSAGEPDKEETLEDSSSSDGKVEADISRDFRCVGCPLNSVKTKLVLEQMSAGDVLAILLDEEGGRNVPASAAEDGHDVLSKDRDGDHWRVVIRKGVDVINDVKEVLK